MSTALGILTAALGTLNVFQPGEAISAEVGADGLARLNRMLGSWALDGLTIPAVAREVFPLVAGQGGPALPYTIGPGGTFNTPRPPSRASLTGVALLQATTIPTEIPRAWIGDEAYARIAQKTLTGSMFVSAHYDPVYAGGLGAIYLWPVPQTSTDSLVIYRQIPLAAFPTLSASYDLPTGYEDAIAYNLALRLATPYGRTVTADVVQLALESLAAVRRSNDTPRDLACDPLYGGRAAGYNIYTGA